MKPPSRRRNRTGKGARASREAFSLLEVILALAILVGAIAVLGELIRIGTRSAAAARDLTQAQLLCESMLAEALAAEALPESISAAPLGDAYPQADGWLYSIEVESLPDAGLYSVKVTVAEDLPAELRPVEFSLVRWLRDPDYSMTGEDQAAATEEAP